jgi:putative ABC transport system permease protein
VTLPRQRYPTSESVARFQEDVIARVSALPAVRHAALVNFLPLNHEHQSREFTPQGWAGSGRLPSADQLVVTPEYFAALGIPLIVGRTFDRTDRPDSPQAAVVNQSLARRYWPGGSPVGATMQFTGAGQPAVIVGVVGDSLQRNLGERGRNQIFLAQAQGPGTYLRLVARTDDDPLAIAGAVTGIVHELDPRLPVVDVRPLDRVVDEFLLPQRSLRVSLAALGVIALALAVIGVYGIVITYVTERTREMGIRMAVGADAGQITRYVLGRGLRLAASGAAIGTPVAVGVAVLARELLFGVSATDPLLYVGVAGSVVIVALLTSLIPARRAARINPLIAIRTG